MSIKHKKVLIVSAAIVLALTVLLCCFFLFFSEKDDKKAAYIYSQGELLYKIDLESENRELTIKTDSGYNTVCIKDGKIGVIEADCPDKTCMKTGFTDSSFIPVICMPHRLEIVIKSDASETDGVSR